MTQRHQILVAYDFSESTVDSRFYHTTVRNIIDRYANYDVILWSNRLQVSNAQELRRINMQMDGRGGTCPKLIAEYLIGKEYAYLVIITDGQIFEKYVKELDDFLVGKQLSIKHVECFLIQTSPEKLDATVIAPFIRHIPHLVSLYRTDSTEPELLTQGDKTADELIQTLTNINTIPEFQQQYDTLFTCVVTQMLGQTQNDPLKRALLALQERLIESMRGPVEGTNYSELITLYQQYMDMIEHNPEAKDDATIAHMVEIIKDMSSKYYQKYQDVSWAPELFHLIRMCSGNLGSVFSLAALSSRFDPTRVHREDVVQHFQLSQVPIIENAESASNGGFVCPVTYEEAHDAMLMIIRPQTPLLKTLSPEIQNKIMADPLVAIQYPQFIDSIVNCIDHPISLKAVKDAETCGKPITISPLTRRPLIGGLCLSKNEAHCKMTDITISQLLSDGKLEDQLDLWYILIWFIIENRHIQYCQEILLQLREHLFYRLSKHEYSLSLMNLPYYCLTKVPLGIGFISSIFNYNLTGTALISQYTNIKSQLPRIEVLLKVCEFMNISISEEMKRFLLKALAYSFILDEISKKNLDLIDTFIRLSYHTIRINKVEFHFDELINAIHEKNRIAQAESRKSTRGRRRNQRGRNNAHGRGRNKGNRVFYQQIPKKLTQITTKCIPQYIPIDGPQTEQEKQEAEQLLHTLPAFIKELTLSELRSATRILEIFSTQKVTFADMFFEEKAAAPIIPAWPNYDHPITLPEISISPATMRPFTTVDTISWDELSQTLFGPLLQQIHLHQMYINFVNIFKIFPNREEFLAYIYNEYVPTEKTALPLMINEYIDCVFGGYNKVFETHPVTPKQFIKLTDISRDLKRRKDIESNSS